jgi:hypothetical protein
VNPVSFAINTGATQPISRFIYGMNFVERGGSPAGIHPWYGATAPAEVTLNRFGGNRLTAFNWETGWSNAGSDYRFQNDAGLVSDGRSYDYGAGIGNAVAGRVNATFARNQGIILTVPMLGYVAGDASAVPLTTTDADRANRLATHFKVSRPFKGSALSLTPSTSDGFVYQDEFVNWVNTTWPNHATDLQRPIFFSLDNEPDVWTRTHKEIQSDSSDDPNRPRLFTYGQFADTTIAYARAIKSVMPNAVVFGPAVATYAGVVSGGRYTSRWFDDPIYGRQNFTDVYLDRLRQAESVYGKRLLDVLDVHYYPAAGDGTAEIGNDLATQTDSMIGARLQSARSLWDASYVEGSWVNSVTGGPIELIPRLRRQIAAHYPGTKIAITEYFFGRGGDISGGLAQADMLGILGREGVFAANLWPNGQVNAAPYNGDGSKAYAFIFGAFKLFLNFDGAGSRYGDTGVSATTSNIASSSVYASLDAQNRVVVVAINKNKTAGSTATLVLTDARALKVTGVYSMTSASATPVAIAGSEVSALGGNKFTYLMPALSATVIVLAP